MLISPTYTLENAFGGTGNQGRLVCDLQGVCTLLLRLVDHGTRVLPVPLT